MADVEFAHSSSPAKKSDLGVRTLSALVMVAVAGTALWLGGWVWTVFVTLVAREVMSEWCALVKGFAATDTYRRIWIAIGLIYVGLAAYSLISFRQSYYYDPVTDLVTLVVGAVVATDVGAYFVGRTFGGPKIAPNISPSKTWSGLLGGSTTAGLFIYFMYRKAGIISSTGDIVEAIILGILAAIIAQAGDFFESWMKRRAGVKDSGTLLPGHGGLFDRVDGLLAVCFVLGIAGMITGRVG